MLSEREARFQTRTFGWSCVGVLRASLAVFGLVTFFYLALLIPWVAALIYRKGRGAIQLFVGKGDRRPNLTHVYGFSLAAPGVWALWGLPRPLRWELLIILGIVIGSLLAVLVVKNHRTWHWAELVVLIAANSFYGFGVAVALNQDLDSATPQTFTAQVLAKRVGRYRRHDYYYLKLAPWGPRNSSQEVQVGNRDYDRAFVGGDRVRGNPSRCSAHPMD